MIRDYSSTHLCICDNNCFIQAALEMSKYFGKVSYFTPWVSDFPTSNDRLFGSGLEDYWGKGKGVHRVDSFWDIRNKVDLWWFPDIYHADAATVLQKDLGKNVFSGFYGDELERFREEAKQFYKKLNVPIIPYEIVYGFDAFRKYIQANVGEKKRLKKVWIKTDVDNRGDFETFPIEDYELTKNYIDELEFNMGALSGTYKFLVEENLEGDDKSPVVELGTDTFNIRGWFPENAMIGIEVKGNCYDKYTEVLTDKGWKYFRDLDRTEKFLALDISDSKHYKMQYEEATDFIVQDYKGKMLHIDSKFIDLKVTPDHNLLIQQNSKDVKTGIGKHKRILKKVNNIDLSKWFSMPHPTSAKFTGLYPKTYLHFGNERISIKMFSALMGMYLSEGWVGKKGSGKRGGGYRIVISQFHYVNEFAEILDKIGLGFKRTKGGWESSNRYLGEYLMQFGKSADKYVPNIIKNSHYKNINIFLHYYCLGDGTFLKQVEGSKRLARRKGQGRTSRKYFTISPKMANDLQELMIKIGNPSIILENEPKIDSRGKASIPYTISERTFQNKNWVLPHQHQWEEYNDKIYCVSVPSHIICVRRKGKVIWCGNCYLGHWGKWSRFPKEATEFSLAIAPALEQYGYQNFISTEIRVRKEHGENIAYQNDLCCRLGHPPNEAELVNILNMPDILFFGSQGEQIEPELKSKFSMQLNLHSTWAAKGTQVVKFEPELRESVRLRRLACIDEQLYIIPRGQGNTGIGCIAVEGDSWEACQKKIEEILPKIKGDCIEKPKESLGDAKEEIEKLADMGIDIENIG